VLRIARQTIDKIIINAQVHSGLGHLLFEPFLLEISFAYIMRTKCRNARYYWEMKKSVSLKNILLIL